MDRLKTMVQIDTAEPHIHILLLLFQILVPPLPTVQLGHWVTSLEQMYQAIYNMSHRRL